MDGGQIIFKFKGDTNDVDKKTNSLSQKFKSIGSTIGKSVVNGTLIATAALTGLVAKAVSASGELEQQIGGTEAVFGKFAETVQNKASKAFETAGISANDYMSYANKIGSLMKGAGIETEQAMNLSSQAMQRASDVASIMGIDVNSAMEAITGAAKGNFTMMDNLGVAMNATNLEAYALQQGIAKSYNEMSQAEKVGLAYQMFLDKTKDYAGNYAKENDTFAGSFNTLKASMQNFISGAGDIDSVIDSFTRFGDILINSISNMAPKIVDGLITMVNSVVGILPGLLDKLLPVVISGAVKLINGLTKALPKLIPVLLNGVVNAFTMLLPLLPQILQTLIQGAIFIVQSLADQMPVLIPQIIDALLQMIPILLNNMPLMINTGIKLIEGLITGIINAIPVLVEQIPQILISLTSALISSIPLLLTAAPRLMISLAMGLIQAIPSLIMAVPKMIIGIVNSLANGAKQFLNSGVMIVSDIWKGFSNGVISFLSKIPFFPKDVLAKIKNGFSGIENIGKNLIKGLWAGIDNAKDWVLSKIKGFGKAVLKGIGDVFGVHSPSREFAWIGKMNMVGLVEGTEDMEDKVFKAYDEMLNMSNFDTMFDLSPNLYNSGSLSMNSSPNITVVNNMETDPLGQVVNKIKTFSGGAKNDYNYGVGV